jgi:hypothetical protein
MGRRLGFARAGVIVCQEADPATAAGSITTGTSHWAIWAWIRPGAILVEDGKHTGALPGHVLRGA